LTGPRAEVEEAFRKAEAMATEALQEGAYRSAVKILFRGAFKPLYDLIARNAEQIARNEEMIAKNNEQLDRLVRAIGELRGVVDRNAEEAARAEREARRLRGETGRLRGVYVEIKVGNALKDWFRVHAPEYHVSMWHGAGCDVVITGRGMMAAVEVAVIPKLEDLRQLKDGIGALKEEWGRKPDLLVVFSQSGVVPEEVAKQAEKLGVKIVRGLRELKRLLDHQRSESDVQT